MRTRVERSKLRFITRRPWGAWRAIAFGAIARATSSLRPSAPRRRSREPPVGPRLGGPKIARRRPRALRRPKVPRLCHGNNNERHSLGPPPAGPDFGASDPPPSGASVASPELRFRMNFQWIYTILLFRLVVADHCAYVYLPQSAGAYWQRSFVFSWKFSYAAGGLRFSSDEVLGVQRSVCVFLI